MKKIIIIISVFIGILVYNKSNEIIIPSDAIRVRIIANSNNIKDLYEKQKLKDEIKNDLYKIVIEANNSEEADKMIDNKLEYINNLVSSKAKDYKINYGLNYFPKKEYKGVVYPEGNYQSLVITLGSGMGENWWCVLYPPLCFIDEKKDDIEYRSIVLDFLKN